MDDRGLTQDADSGYDLYHGFYGQGASNKGGAFFVNLNNKIGGGAAFIDPNGTTVNLPRIVPDAYINDGTNSTSLSTIVSATASFASTDVGQPIGAYTQYQNSVCPLVPGCVIQSVTNSTTAQLSLPTTASGSAVTVAIGQQPYFRPFSNDGGGRWRKNFTTLWFPQAGYLYLLRNDQVVSEVNLNPYMGTGTGQLDITQTVAAQTQMTAQDGSAHNFTWARSELILAHD